MHFLHSFSHLPFTFSQLCIWHFVWWSLRPLHSSSGGEGGGGKGGGGEGGADGGSASHKPQVFLHCSFCASEYFFLHFFSLHLLCVSAQGCELGDGGDGGDSEGLGGGGEGDGGGSEGGGGEGATTTRTETVGTSTLSTVTPAARDRAEALLARACTEATTLAASPTT